MSKVNLTKSQVRELAQDLIGTSGTIEETIVELFGEEYNTELKPEEKELFDNIVFLCNDCEWWCSKESESGEKSVCNECG